MDRRNFLKAGAALAAGALPASAAGAGQAAAGPGIPRRKLGKTGEELSIIGMGGVVVMREDQSFANNVVAEAFDRGLNYFDVAPSYDNAQERLGPALEPYRKRCFLACKTLKRDGAGAQAELEESLRLLRTDHLDLYQFHAIRTAEDVEKILAPGGALETFVAARKAGKIRFIGFSAHSAEAALDLLDRFAFDTILFPTNFVLFQNANFGPQVLAKARARGMGLLALKAMAKTAWPKWLAQKDRPFPKCWYVPCSDPEEARLALRWTLSQEITAAVPPGDPKLFRIALTVAENFTPLAENERETLRRIAQGQEPIFRLAG